MPMYVYHAFLVATIWMAPLCGQEPTAARLEADWLRQAELRERAPRRDGALVPDTAPTLARGRLLAAHLRELGVNVDDAVAALASIERRASALEGDAAPDVHKTLYFEARAAVRRLAFSNPLLTFDSVLFVKRVPGTLPHMSDQHYGWWSRPGGGIYILEGFKTEQPRVRCLTDGSPAGSFCTPELSYDARSVLFSYCRYYPHVAGMEKVDKGRLPEDAFYHVCELSIAGGPIRRITAGRYDDFDGRYLPDGAIVFLSTRKGQAVQVGKDSAMATLATTLPDSYVRCGGDNTRPCAVFTLHAMDARGGNLRAISAFENFEWTPTVAADGRLLYARWDYIDRFNGHFESLWSSNPDGTNPQLVYGNFTVKPQCVFEARSVPGSDKLVFTASAHHSITGGALALLDQALGSEGETPLTRLTPEVCFPETEGWPNSYYANPWPLSETFFLVTWSDRTLPPHAGSSQITDERNPPNACGIYLYDTFGNLELLYRDDAISSMHPIPIAPRALPPVRPSHVAWDDVAGSFMLQDVYAGLRGIPRGTIARLRIVAVPPKPQPHMDSPHLGVSREDPGKFVLGTVPVEDDGSAHFLAPAGVPVFFQALDRDGAALQTMRTLTYAHGGRALACIGCHEPRSSAPPVTATPRAFTRAPSRITPGPEGSWPLRFDTLVQGVLDANCVRCHSPASPDPAAARLDLSADKAYDALLAFADKDLERLSFEKDVSIPGECPSRTSKLVAAINDARLHPSLALDAASWERLRTWIDVYAHKLGSFGEGQEEELRALKRKVAALLVE